MVDVVAQPCDTPNRQRGRGLVIDDGIVVTAAHTVDGALRELAVDGAPATIVALDRRTDLALLAAPIAQGPAALELDDVPTEVTVDGHDVRITSTGPLIVNDVTDGTRHQREAHRFAPAVPDGTSGAPLLDADGRVVGIVVLDTYAVAVDEVAALLDAARVERPPPPPTCPG